jgi:hypothetical protein
MKRSTIVVILTLVGFVAFLLWTTLSAQKVECAVCVEFGGGRNCATATASDSSAAAEAAQNTACGTLARGMTETIACGNVKPESRVCRTR